MEWNNKLLLLLLLLLLVSMVLLQSISWLFLFHLQDSVFFGIVIFGLFTNYIILLRQYRIVCSSLLRIPFPHANIIVVLFFLHRLNMSNGISLTSFTRIKFTAL